MSQQMNLADKFDIQNNFRRYMRIKDSQEAEFREYKKAKASRLWIIAIILLFLAISSKFFLGAAAALLVVYFYRLVSSWLRMNSYDERIDELDRWFRTKSLKFEGRILYFQQDDMLENPLDPFADEHYQ